ncbi:MAG: hypothetical protein KDD69_17615 [Bdellovibrionales bacterium]|nr:hypothetical protein [Bdellovibrionales bacterium]
MNALANLTAVEFLTWVFAFIVALSFVGWVAKKNFYVGILLGLGLVYVVLQTTGLNPLRLLDLFR